MRIPTGNFGNVTPQPQPTRVNVEGVGAPAQGVMKLADDVQQQVNAVVRGRAGDELLDYQIKIKDINESIRSGVEDGTLRADQVETFYQTAVSKLDKPQFAGLDIATGEVAQRGITRYESDGMSTARNYAHTALKIEARELVDSHLDQLGKLTNYPDADIEKINTSMDALSEQGRIAYGSQWGKVKQSAIDKNWYNQAQQRLMQARSDGSALAALNNDLTADNGFYLDKLDPDKRNALLNQSMNYQITLENRARASEAKRESMAARAYNEFAQQVYMDLPTTAEQQTGLINAVRGTSVEGEVKDLLADQLKIREVVSQGPVASQNYLNNLYAELNANGGDMKQWRLAQRLTTAVQKSTKQLTDTPLIFNQNRTGEAVTPLDMTALNPALSTVTSAMEGMDVTSRFTQQIQERSATIDAISQNTGMKVPRKILLPQEATAIASALHNKPTGEQASILAQLRKAIPNDSDYKAVMLQVYPEAPTAALAGSLPDQKSANKVLQGYEQLKNQKGDMATWNKAKNDFIAFADEYTGSALAGRPEARQTLLNVAFAYHVGNSVQKGEYSTDVTQSQVKEAINNTVGEVTRLGGAEVFVPPGVSVSDFKYRYPALLYKALERQGMDVSRAQQAGLFNLLPAGSDGNYFVAQGRDALIDSKGQPLTVNLSKSTIDSINNAEAAAINTKIGGYSIYGYSKSEDSFNTFGAE